MNSSRTLHHETYMDYLLRSALDRIQQLEKEIKNLHNQEIVANETIRLRQANRIVTFQVIDILYIQAEDNCSRVFLRNGTVYYACRTLKSWVNELPDDEFIRCSRTYLVNRKEVVEIHRGNHELILKNESRIPVSRRFQKNCLSTLFPKKESHTKRSVARIHPLQAKIENVMKSITILLFCCFGFPALHAQVSLGTNPTTPDATAVLDLQSNSKGLLIPRMLESERSAIPFPATSLIVYQTDGIRGFYYYDGGAWTMINPGNAGWKIDGNSGTNGTFNFVGTTDNQPLCFRVNNISAGKIKTDGMALGYNAGLNDPMPGNTVIGTNAFSANATGIYNVAIGQDALQDNNNGGGNVAIGTSAMANNISGYMNTMIGMECGINNTGGAENTAYGSLSLRNNTTGNENMAIGRLAGYNNTTGNENLFIGYGAGRTGSILNKETYIGFNAGYNTTSNINNFFYEDPNVFVGSEAGYQNLTGAGNVFVGRKAGYANQSGNYNSAMGSHALAANTTGYSNCAFGQKALTSNTTGGANVAMGVNALFGNVDGLSNAALGSSALALNTSGDSNVALGESSMFGNQTGNNNTAVGASALHGNSAGNENVALGFLAMYNNTANENTAIGSRAMYANTSGQANTAVGMNVLKANTTGSNNTGVGKFALSNNTEGISNVAIGVKALNTATTGDRNIAIGNSSLESLTFGDNNVAVGDSTLQKNVTGSSNIGIGKNALKKNTNGSTNIAIGYKSIENNSTGSGNAAIGTFTLNDNTTGYDNVAVGGSALSINTTGYENIAIGWTALSGNETGNNTVAIGTRAMPFNNSGQNVGIGSWVLYTSNDGSSNTAIGFRSQFGNSTGSVNTSIGMNSGESNTTGTYNTFLGASADATVGTLTKATAIGFGATVGASNSMVLGGTGSNKVNVGIGVTSPTATLHVKQGTSTGSDRGLRLERAGDTQNWRIYTGQGTDPDLGFILNETDVAYINGADGMFHDFSDARLKKDIAPIDHVLDKVLQLQPKSYTPAFNDSGVKVFGFIAQDVELLFPNIVGEREDGYKSLAYDEFSVLAIQAIKEQQAMIQQQQQVINDLLVRVRALEQK